MLSLLTSKLGVAGIVHSTSIRCRTPATYDTLES